MLLSTRLLLCLSGAKAQWMSIRHWPRRSQVRDKIRCSSHHMSAYSNPVVRRLAAVVVPVRVLPSSARTLTLFIRKVSTSQS